MKMQNTKGIIVNLLKGGSGIAPTSAVVQNDKSQFGATVSRIEINQVDDADGLPFRIINHHTHLTVCIDIIGNMGHIVVEHITGIGHIRGSYIP